MARVIEHGRGRRGGPVPGGIRTTCVTCGAVLETVQGQPGEYISEVSEGRPLNGWRITCPECGAQVFIDEHPIGEARRGPA